MCMLLVNSAYTLPCWHALPISSLMVVTAENRVLDHLTHFSASSVGAATVAAPAPMAANPEDIDLDEGDDEDEEEGAGADGIQLEQKPVPVSCLLHGPLSAV